MSALITSAIEQGLFKPATSHPHWSAELTSSAISPEVADGWLYWTDNKGVLQELGLHPKLLGNKGGGDTERNHWLVRVLRDHHGNGYAVEAKPRFPGGSAKYVSPKGHTGVDVRQGTEQGAALFIVEGGKKAAAVASLNYDVVAINGCWGWGAKRDEELKRMKQKMLHPQITAQDLKDREVVVILDADVTTNLNVNHAARSLLSLLNSAGARATIMPAIGEGTEGIDDVLASLQPEQRQGAFLGWLKRRSSEVPPLTAEAEAELVEDRGCYTTDKGEPITNFTVEVQGETTIINNDGVQQDRTVDVVIHHQRQGSISLSIRTEDLRDGGIWKSHLLPIDYTVSSAGAVFATTLFNEIMAHQSDYLREEKYGFVGWRGDQYLLPGLTIGPSGRLDDTVGLHLYEEGENKPWGHQATLVEPQSEEDLQRAKIAVFDLIHFIPPQLVLAPFGAVLESTELHWWLYGMTSKGKTEALKILLSFWGNQLADDLLQFQTITKSAFGTTAAKIPGLLMGLDDAVNSVGVTRETEFKLNDFIRQAFGQGGGYQKGTRSGTGTRTLGSIRSSLFFTAESVAGEASFRNRLIEVQMPPTGLQNFETYWKDVDINKREGVYSMALFDWIRFIASKGGPKQVWQDVKQRGTVEMNVTEHRSREIVTRLLGLCDLMQEWAGSMSAPALDTIREAVLSSASESERQMTKDVGTATTFIDVVGQMLLGRDYKVQSKGMSVLDNLPDNAFIFEGGRSLGWADVEKNHLYLDKSRLRWILAEARTMGRVLSGVVDNDTGRGIVGRALDDHYGEDVTDRLRLNDKRQRVWRIPLTDITGG
jgi:hypothetical protein